MGKAVSFRSCRCVFSLFLFAVVSVLSSPVSHAQTSTGAITGTVTDPNGLATADATVVVKNSDTDTETTYTSNGAGLYAAPYLQPTNIGTSILGSAINSDGGMTGAEVSTFAGPTGGRISWQARNLNNLPNFTNVDLRVGRGFSFHERYKLNLVVDAFNAFNSTIVSGVNTTAYTYTAPGSGVCTGHSNGCLVPVPTFGTVSTTSGALYGARQLQFGARFDF
jgi:hypothetical protein